MRTWWNGRRARLKIWFLWSTSSSLVVRTNVKVNVMSDKIMPPSSMVSRLDAALAEAEEYKKRYEAAMKVVRSTYAEKFPDTYFITGELGLKDHNNMPAKILVCPAYGLDFTYVYERTEKVSGPEW